MISSKLSQPNYANFLDRIQHAKKMAGNAKPLELDSAQKPNLRMDRVTLSSKADDVLRGATKPLSTPTTRPVATPTAATASEPQTVDSQAIERLFVQIRDVMGRIRDLAQKASDPTLTGAERADYTNKFNQLLNVEFRQLPYNLQGMPAKAQEAIGRFVNPELWAIDRGTTNIGFARAEDAATIVNNIDSRLGNLDNIGRSLVRAQLDVAGFVAGRVDTRAINTNADTPPTMPSKPLHVHVDPKPSEKPIESMNPRLAEERLTPDERLAASKPRHVHVDAKPNHKPVEIVDQLRELLDKA